MIELPFGSVSPVWPGSTAGWVPATGPVVNRVTPAPFGTQPISVANLGSTPVFRTPQSANPPGPEPYGFVAAPPLGQSHLQGPGTGIGMPIIPNFFGFPVPSAGVFTQSGLATIPGLLMAIAARRGQPAGPNGDQEIEDFVYDVFELLPGTADVEIRCEAGRATLTGTVHQKRLKHDIGEIVWAIPVVNDVQNNIAIATKRRTRPGSREESTSTTGRKQG